MGVENSFTTSMGVPCGGALNRDWTAINFVSIAHDNILLRLVNQKRDTKT